MRVWRSDASSRSNIKSSRQRAKLEYQDKLKERYKYMPEINRIARHRHLPKPVKKAQDMKRLYSKSKKRVYFVVFCFEFYSILYF